MSDVDGAVDNGYGDAERDPRSVLAERAAQRGGEHAIMASGDIAIDLVTREVLRILEPVAPDLPTYYDDEGVDLLTYNQHQYLPVRMDDIVFRCVFVGDLDELHRERKTYDYPAGRLARVPLWARLEDDGGNSETIIGDGGYKMLERNCPWCAHDTLVRDVSDERCTREHCEFSVQGKYRERGGDD